MTGANVKVSVTELGFSSLNILCRYMCEFIGEEAAISLAENLLDMAEQHLQRFPLKCPVCHELEILGVTDYRQLTIDKYKILYRFDDVGNTVYIMAFMRQKQSAQELLISCVLL